jgi:ribonuclease PH
VALHEALSDGVDREVMARNPIIDHVAAISIGMVEGVVLLDLDYEDDVRAEVDMNVVMSGRGLLIEVQGTAERAPFSRDELDQMLDVSSQGIDQLVDAQRRAVVAPG